MSDEDDPIATAFDALSDDTRRLDTAEPLRSLGEAQTGVGRRPLLLGTVTVAVLVIVGVVLFRDSGNDDLIVGPVGAPGLDDGQQDLSPADPATLVGSAWTLVSGTGPDGVVPFVDGWPITLTFDPETLGGTAACNGYGADYSLDGSRLAIEEIGRDLMGCADPVAASEAAFLAAVADTDSLFVRGDELILSGPSTELRFRDVPPVPTAELVGRLWLLETLVQDETASSVRGDPATLRLDSDGTFVGGTGCRTFFGDYRVAGGEVRLSSFEAEGECPAELRDQDNIVVSVITDGFTVGIESVRLTLTSVGNEGLTYRSVTEAEFGSLTGDRVTGDAGLLPGTTWILRQGEGPDGPIDIIAGFEPVISFQADATVTGNTSCNDFSADFAADGNRLSFGTLSQTVQGCFEAGVVEAESAFRAALVDVSDFATEADGDELVLTGNATELVFDRAESTVLSAPTTVDLATTPDGRFRYSVTYPGPRGSRWNGVLIVDDGSGAVPALRDERDEFDEVHDMIFGPDGLVAWTSDDANYGSWMFLGRIDETGRIVDSRRVGDLRTEVMVRGEFDDTMLVGEAYSGLEIVVDTENDPFFVMSADPVPGIETDAPLVPVLESDGYWAREQPGFWYRGDTLGHEPACGASTLYKDDADGFARVLDTSIEIETVVDVDVDEDFGTGGGDTVGAARAVVLSTECPSQYEGRRVYWGIETIDYGDQGPRVESPLIVEAAPHSPVAEVLAVTAVVTDVDCCPWVSLLRIDVELLDGTTTTIDVEV